MNYTYILQCADGTYYTGWTNNLEKRVEDHNQKMCIRDRMQVGPGTKDYGALSLAVQYLSLIHI